MNYKNGFVTFFDILGFKKMIHEKSCGEVNDIVNIFYKENNQVVESAGDCNYDINTISFSDSIIRVSVLNEEYSDRDYCEVFLNELINLSCIQMSLIKAGILVRGGIAFGEIYIDKNENIAFGLGFNEAYKLESEIAEFPRIVVSPDIMNTFEDIFNDECENMISNIIKCLKLDRDGLFYVDYLKQSMSLQFYIQEHKNGKVDKNIFFEDMKAHKKLIVNSIKSQLDIKVEKKYNWLTSYHNEINSKSDKYILSEEEAIETLISPDDNYLYKEYMTIYEYYLKK